MPRKMTYEERMAKAMREQQAVESRLRKIADEKKKVDQDRLLSIARGTKLLQLDDEILIPEVRQLVGRLLSRSKAETSGEQHA